MQAAAQAVMLLLYGYLKYHNLCPGLQLLIMSCFSEGGRNWLEAPAGNALSPYIPSPSPLSYLWMTLSYFSVECPPILIVQAQHSTPISQPVVRSDILDVALDRQREPLAATVPSLRSLGRMGSLHHRISETDTLADWWFSLIASSLAVKL